MIEVPIQCVMTRYCTLRKTVSCQLHETWCISLTIIPQTPLTHPGIYYITLLQRSVLCWWLENLVASSSNRKCYSPEVRATYAPLLHYGRWQDLWGKSGTRVDQSDHSHGSRHSRISTALTEGLISQNVEETKPCCLLGRPLRSCISYLLAERIAKTKLL